MSGGDGEQPRTQGSSVPDPWPLAPLVPVLMLHFYTHGSRTCGHGRSAPPVEATPTYGRPASRKRSVSQLSQTPFLFVTVSAHKFKALQLASESHLHRRYTENTGWRGKNQDVASTQKVH